MNKKTVFLLWAGLFILCALLGFIQPTDGILRGVLFVTALVFFLPPAYLLYKSEKTQDRDTVLLIRNLSLCSLLGTLICMVLNILSALWPIMAGNILHTVLTIVSSPMMCSGNWFLSMFLWACLLMVSRKLLKK